MNGFYGSGSTDALIRVHNGTKHTEIAEEFILPDYLPDIKRVIRADAAPKIDGKYLSDGKLSFDGEVACRMLYTDEQNCLKSVTFTAAFSDSAEIACVSSECIANLLPSPESLICRAVNPRRVSVRMRLDTEVSVWCTRSFRPVLSGDYGATTEVLTEEIGCVKLICAGDNSLSAAADIEVDGALPQIGAVIACDVGMSFFECKPADGRVLCRGEMPITVFYSSPTEDGESYTALFRKLPIAQVMNADGVTEGYECNARGSVSEIKVNVSENGFGERRILELDVSYRMYLNCVTNGNVTVTRDVYACNKDVETKEELAVFNRFARNYSTTVSVNHIGEIADIFPSEPENVLGVFSRPKVKTIKLEDGKRLVLEGVAENGAVLNCADGICGADYAVPFKAELEASGIPAGFEYSCDAVCMGARARIDSGKVYTDIELQINLMILGSEEKTAVVGAVFTDKTTVDDGRGVALRLFYPADGESLWSIGKQFGISRERIAEANGMTDTSVLPQVIMIPIK